MSAAQAEPQDADPEAASVSALASRLSDLASDAARRYVTPASLRRHLRARDGDVEAAERQVRATVEWRAAEAIDAMRPEDLAHVAALNALYTGGHDRAGNPIIVMRVGAYNPYSPEDRLRYVTQVMETVFPAGRDDADVKATWILDFSLFGKKRSTDGRAVMKRTQAVLQDHYPERLCRAFVVDPPWFFYWLYQIVSLFMSEKTRSKIVIVTGGVDRKREALGRFIDPGEMEQRFGGERPDLVYTPPSPTLPATAAPEDSATAAP
eukprot:m51a1_g5558 hypothetical protein (265) ;mRNA; r:561104-562049